MSPVVDGNAPRKRAATWFWVIFHALGLFGGMVGCVWAAMTLPLSFPGAFGLFGGHWAFGLLMPVMIVSLIGLMLSIGRLRRQPPTGSDETANASENETQSGDSQ